MAAQVDDSDYVEFLAEQTRSTASVLHQFILLFNPNDDSIHIFFEGAEDFLYYPAFLRATIDFDSAHMHNCRGKPVVRQLKDFISRNGYPSNRCLYFVDRDFDDYLDCQMVADESTYITDGYSIENDIATVDAAKILLTDVVGLGRGSDEFNLVISSLNQSVGEFNQAIRPIMAWCIAVRAKGGKVNLNNAKLSGVFNISRNGKVKRKTNGFAGFIRSTKSGNIAPTTAELKTALRRISTDDPRKWVRGKYALWHFELALAKALEIINEARSQANEQEISIPSALRAHQMFELMGGRIPPPSSLLRFLDNR